MTAEWGGLRAQSAFLDHQRRHACTDCGHSYLDQARRPRGRGYRRYVVGGGTIVSSVSGPIREVHILPHCGTELPLDLLAEVDPDDLSALAHLVHENVDLGTGAIYRTLVEDVVAGRTEGVVVAGFHLSRLLLDANRATVEEQLPHDPYVGSAEIYQDYRARHGDELREQALLPWLAAIDEVLGTMDARGVVYHHHTYDVYSMSPRPYDQGVTGKRPPFQLVWQRPSWQHSVGEAKNSTDPGLARLEDLKGIRDRIRQFLQAEMGLSNGHGDIDYPLRLPVLPFAGARREDPPGAPRHVVYDLRKEILVTEEHIRSWVHESPWRLRNGRPGTGLMDLQDAASVNPS